MPPELDRRSLLAGSLALAGLLAVHPPLALAAPRLLVENVTQLYPVEVVRIVVSHSAAVVAAAVVVWSG